MATGEAYFGPVGRGGQATHSVLGPLVNRAARLQGRAAAGQVLADQATYRRTHQAFAYRSPDSAGTPASAQAYEVAGALARPAKTRGIEGLRAELIGRDEELAKLEAALARVRAGQGQVVSLISEAGLGKSRLVAELKSAIVTHAEGGRRLASRVSATSNLIQSAALRPTLRACNDERSCRSSGWKAAAWKWRRARRMGRSWTCCTVISR